MRHVKIAVFQDRLIHRPGRSARNVEVARLRQHLGLEAAHRARGGRAPFSDSSTRHMPQGRVHAKPLGIVRAFLALQPAEEGLTQQRYESVLGVLPGSPVPQLVLSHSGQAQRIIQLPLGQQARIRVEVGTVKLQLQTAIEVHPKRPLFAFTHRILPFTLPPACE